MEDLKFQPVGEVADRLAREAESRRRERDLERFGYAPRQPMPKHKLIVALAKARARAARVMGVV